MRTLGVLMALVLASQPDDWCGRAMTADPVTAGAAAGVGGIALLYAFGRLGLTRYLRRPASASYPKMRRCGAGADLCLAAVSGDFPRGAASRTAGATAEVVAATLGARPGTVWWRVTLPLLLPGRCPISTGVCPLLGEFGAF